MLRGQADVARLGATLSAVAGVTFIYVQWLQVSNTATVSTTFLLIVLVVSQVAHLTDFAFLTSRQIRTKAPVETRIEHADLIACSCSNAPGRDARQ